MPKQREPLAADDETVCSFCGMSHLMYTETKKLEKVRATLSCCSLLVLPILLFFFTLSLTHLGLSGACASCRALSTALSVLV